MAIDIGKEILKLNENNNTGTWYNLLALYALLEDETSLLDLYSNISNTVKIFFPW